MTSDDFVLRFYKRITIFPKLCELIYLYEGKILFFHDIISITISTYGSSTRIFKCNMLKINQLYNGGETFFITIGKYATKSSYPIFEIHGLLLTIQTVINLYNKFIFEETLIRV